MQILVRIAKAGVRGLALCSMLYALCFLLVFTYGCRPRHFARLKTDIGTVKKIAVLPFENFTSDEYAGEKIRKLVITELLSKGVDVTEPGEVTRLLRELKIKSLGSLKITEIQDIGKALDVRNSNDGLGRSLRNKQGDFCYLSGGDY